jgi:hypothetical protein
MDTVNYPKKKVFSNFFFESGLISNEMKKFITFVTEQFDFV